MRELLTRTDKVFCESIGAWENESRNHKVVSLSRVVEIMSSVKEDHDYQFENDYDIVTPDEQFLSVAEEVIAAIKKDIADIVPDFSVGYAKDIGGEKLGKYVDGTYSHPMIVLDVDQINKGAAKYDVDIAVAIESTIMHELGHAIAQKEGVRASEKTVEDFAHHYYETGKIDKFWIKEATAIDSAPHVDSLTANQDTEKLLQLIHIHRGRPIGVQGLGGVKVGDEVIVKGDYQVDYPSWNGIAIAGTELGTVLVYDPDTEQVYELSARELDY